MTKAAIGQRAHSPAGEARRVPRAQEAQAFGVPGHRRRRSVAASRHASDAEADSPPDRFRRRAAERHAARPAGRRTVGCARVRGPSSRARAPASALRELRDHRTRRRRRRRGVGVGRSSRSDRRVRAASDRCRADIRRAGECLRRGERARRAPRRDRRHLRRAVRGLAAGPRGPHAAQAPPAVARLRDSGRRHRVHRERGLLLARQRPRPRAGSEGSRSHGYRTRRERAGHGLRRAAPTDAATEEKVDALIEQAQRAMRDRHFIDPADGSALALYRSALTLDPGAGRRGRVCSAWRKYCSRAFNRRSMSGSSTRRCRRSRRRAASTPRIPGCRRSTSAS